MGLQSEIMKIGVLAIQGDFAEHIVMLKRLGVETAEVRFPVTVDGLDGIIIPGGESTTIGKLAVDYGLLEPLRKFGKPMRCGAPVQGQSFSRRMPAVTSPCWASWTSPWSAMHLVGRWTRSKKI